MSDTNQPVQSEKLENSDTVDEALYYPCDENKGAASLFSHMQKDFLMTRLNFLCSWIQYSKF